MIWKFRLRTKLLGAFILVGLLVLGISYIGWQSNSRLANAVTSVDDDLEKLTWMLKVHDGLTSAAAAERMLINPQLTWEQRQQEWTDLNASMTEIEEGLHSYEALPRPGEEDKLTQVATYK
jgi:methyl-accepting chemotaxis protein WspA